jgi:hypothetical protein
MSYLGRALTDRSVRSCGSCARRSRRGGGPGRAPCRQTRPCLDTSWTCDCCRLGTSRCARGRDVLSRRLSPGLARRGAASRLDTLGAHVGRRRRDAWGRRASGPACVLLYGGCMDIVVWMTTLSGWVPGAGARCRLGITSGAPCTAGLTAAPARQVRINALMNQRSETPMPPDSAQRLGSVGPAGGAPGVSGRPQL